MAATDNLQHKQLAMFMTPRDIAASIDLSQEI